MVVSGPGGPVRLAYKKLHTRRILTLFGEVTLTRVGYGAPGQSSIHPLDAELGLPARSYSYEICRRLVGSAVCGPFDEATSLVAEMTGLVVPKRSAERIVLEAAVDFEDSSSTRGGSQAQLSPKEIVVGAIDCKGIPMVKPEGADQRARRPTRRAGPSPAAPSRGHART